MARFHPTLPQWKCTGCARYITRNTAYRVSIFETPASIMIGINRNANGAYCIRCVREEVNKEECTHTKERSHGAS